MEEVWEGREAQWVSRIADVRQGEIRWQTELSDKQRRCQAYIKTTPRVPAGTPGLGLYMVKHLVLGGESCFEVHVLQLLDHDHEHDQADVLTGFALLFENQPAHKLLSMEQDGSKYRGLGCKGGHIPNTQISRQITSTHPHDRPFSNQHTFVTTLKKSYTQAPWLV